MTDKRDLRWSVEGKITSGDPEYDQRLKAASDWNQRKLEEWHLGSGPYINPDSLIRMHEAHLEEHPEERPENDPQVQR